jgi:glyoxylase-like metal-dependent hydrolase (beta-lactamase superfamily II)
MAPAIVINYDHGISAVDAVYDGRHSHSAIHVVLAGGLTPESASAAIVDTGTNYSIPALVEALARMGVTPEQVVYVIVTHVHLDHAGGAGEAMRRFPNAKLVVHPRGARHMIDPSKLVAGTIEVYGAEKTRAVYGEIVPVAAERVIEAADGFRLDFNGRELLFLDTPGHARHHFCIFDETSGGIFTGDSFGISYREFDVDGRAFIFPAATPVQFEPEAAHAAIDRLMALKPQAAYLTHYSRVTGLERLAADLHRRLDDFVALAHRVPDTGDARHRELTEKLAAYLLGELAGHGCRLAQAEILRLLAGDVELNAQGLEVWLDREVVSPPT